MIVAAPFYILKCNIYAIGTLRDSRNLLFYPSHRMSISSSACSPAK